MGRTYYSNDIKKKIVEEFYKNHLSTKEISKKYNINFWTICTWVYKKNNVLNNNQQMIDVTPDIVNSNYLKEKMILKINSFNIEINSKDITLLLRGIKNA